MIPCFKCKFTFSSLDSLHDHFVNDHQITFLEPIECRFNSCPRTASNWHCFQKHFLRAHGREISIIASLPSSHDEENASSRIPENSLQCYSETTTFPTAPTNASGSKEALHSSVAHQAAPTNASGSNEAPHSIVEHQESPILSDENINAALEAKIFSFCSNMYSHVGIPLSHAQMTINSVQELIQGIHNAYKQKVLNLSADSNSENITGVVQRMNEAFTLVENSVRTYKSKHRTLKVLKEKGFFFPPKLKFLGSTSKRRKFQKRYCVVSVKESSAFIPLRHVFRKLFEQEHVLSKVLQYLEDLKSEDLLIENVVQGEFWKNLCKNKSKNGVILPIFLDNDCIEVGSALSGHAGIQKVNATFCSIPCLLPEMRASLKSIFLILLTKSSNLKRFGNEAVFMPVIRELNFLSNTGITVRPPDSAPVKLFFQVCTLVGDNLGLNSIGGFVRNFSKSEYCCRQCRAALAERQFYTKEVLDLLWTLQTYAKAVTKNNFRETGIRERCTLNDLIDFHIITNGGVDVTHDLFEGVVQYVLCFILKHYIYKKKFFSLSTVNERISKFNYGSADISNKPPPLPETLKKKTTLKMSASETACLFKFFGLLIGDLIPDDDEVWPLYIALRKVVEITMSPSVDLSVCDLLATYISEFLLLYISIARKPLVFKFHNLIHYPRLMARFGPLVHLSTIRFESKNRVLKISANAVACRRNICLTIARKCQLQLSHDFFCKTFSKKKIIFGPNELVESSDNPFDEITCTTSIPEILKDKQTIRTSWLEINGTRYSEGETLCAEVEEDTSLPIFGWVKKIFLCNSGEVFFLLRNFRTISFKNHLYAFELELSKSYSIVKYEDLDDFHPHSAISILADNFYVTLLSRA